MRAVYFRKPHNLLAWEYRIGICGLQTPYGAEGTEHRALTKSSTVKTSQSSTVKENMPLAFIFAEKINLLVLQMFKRN